MNISEIEIKTVALRTGLSGEKVEAVVREFQSIGWRLDKPMTHADVTLPRLGIPGVLEGDK